MHAVARNGPVLGLVLMLLAPLGVNWAVTAGVRAGAGPEAAGIHAGADGAASTTAAIVGQRAPDLSLPSLRSGDDSIQLSDYRGKVVYLDFWSSWCAPCRRTMPHLDALRQEFSRNDFEVVGVNVDLLADDARRLLEKIPVSYPIGTDAGLLAARRFGVDALPALFVLDRDGVVVRAVRGGGLEARDELRAALVELIGEREVQ